LKDRVGRGFGFPVGELLSTSSFIFHSFQCALKLRGNTSFGGLLSAFSTVFLLCAYYFAIKKNTYKKLIFLALYLKKYYVCKVNIVYQSNNGY